MANSVSRHPRHRASRVTAVAAAAGLALVFGNCAPAKAGGACPPIPRKDQYTIGWAQISNNNAFRLTETDSIAKVAAQRGFKLVQTDANDDTAKQLSDVEDLLSKGIDILALPPREFEASAPALAAAKAKNIPVFLVDRSAKGTAGADYVTVMSSNFIKQGQMGADWVIKHTGGKAKIVELTGTPGASASIERSKGFDDAIAGQKDMKIVAQQSANFDQATAQQVTEQIIQSTGGDFNVVYTSADVMALGAIAALKSAGIAVGGDKGVIVTGMDGNKAAMKSIADGQMSMSVETNPRFGPLLFDTIARYLSCETIPAYVPVQDRVFDKTNVDQKVIDEAF